jgi:Flp pilus assembly pilin Flp
MTHLARPPRACPDGFLLPVIFQPVFPFTSRRVEMLRRLIRCKKGQGMVEYAMLVAGVALIAAVSVAILGHKTSDMLAAVAAVLPGAHAEDNGPIESGKLIETTQDANNQIELDSAGIAGNANTPRLGTNVLGPTTAAGAADFGGLVLEVD